MSNNARRGAHTWPVSSALFEGVNLNQIEEEDSVIPEENVCQALSKLKVNNGEPVNHAETFVQPEAQTGFAIFRYLGSITFENKKGTETNLE